MTGARARTGLCVIVVAALLASPEAFCDKKWKKEQSCKGIAIWSRDVEGSSYVATKAVATFAATTGEVWDFLSDAKNLKKVSPNLAEIRDLGSCGTNCRYVYQRIHHPLIKDRHCVLEVRWEVIEKDGLSTYRRETRATKAKKPPVSGPLLVETMSGTWVLAPAGDGKRTRMTRTSHLDIGGNVPPGIFNAGAVKNTFRFMEKVKRSFE